MHSIMPEGYSRKHLENKLRQARAGELAGANQVQRARVEKEIRAEVDRRLGQARWGFFSRCPVLW